MSHQRFIRDLISKGDTSRGARILLWSIYSGRPLRHSRLCQMMHSERQFLRKFGRRVPEWLS